MKVKINWIDGTASFMYGEYTERQIDIMYDQLKREPKKRLYKFGIRFDLIKSIEILNERR